MRLDEIYRLASDAVAQNGPDATIVLVLAGAARGSKRARLLPGGRVRGHVLGEEVRDGQTWRVVRYQAQDVADELRPFAVLDRVVHEGGAVDVG